MKLTPAQTYALITSYAAKKAAAIAEARAIGASLWAFGRPWELEGSIYQDSAATTPARGTDAIGSIRDLAMSSPLTQGTAGNKPTLELGPNGFVRANLDGTDDFLAGPGLTCTEEWGLWAGTVATLPTSRVLIGRRFLNNGWTLRVENSGTWKLYIGTGAGIPSIAFPGPAINTPCVIRVHVASGAQSIFVNGTLAATDTQVFSALSSASPFGVASDTGGSAVNIGNGTVSLVAYGNTIPQRRPVAIERLAGLLTGVNIP